MPQDHAMDIAFVNHRIQEQIDLFLVNIGLGFNPYLERRARMHDAMALNALSDRELARLGLARCDIAAAVFGDLFTQPS